MLSGKKKIECIWARSIQVLYIVVHSNAQKEQQTSIYASGVATGVARGRVPPLTAKKLPKIGKNQEKIGKNSGKKRNNREEKAN